MTTNLGRHFLHELKKILLILIAFATVLVSFGELRAEAPDSDDFKVIVNQENKHTMLSRQEVMEFYLKLATTWRDETPVTPLVLPRDSKVHERFVRDILNRSTSEFEAYWYDQVFHGGLQPPETVNSDEEVIEHVKSNPGAIGYVSKSARVKGVTVLEIVD